MMVLPIPDNATLGGILNLELMFFINFGVDR